MIARNNATCRLYLSGTLTTLLGVRRKVALSQDPVFNGSAIGIHEYSAQREISSFILCFYYKPTF
jgi:hypothetical protein